MKTKIGIGAGFILACVLGGALFATTAAGATDKPYEVYPDRIVFESPMVDGGHVNIRVSNPDGSNFQLNWHMEGKCITKTDHECANVRHDRVGLTLHEEALLIGKTVLPVPLKKGQCIEWVQWSETGYHYGENGEPPVCLSDKPDIPLTPETPDIPNPTPPERVETAASGLQEVELHLTVVVLIWALIILGAITATGIIVNTKAHGDSILATFAIVFAGAGFLITVSASLIAGYPYDFKYYQIYETLGVVESVSNTFSEDDGSIVRVPVVEFSSLDRPIVVEDPRIIKLVGSELELSCTLEWVYQSEDRIHCTIRKIL